MPLSHKSLNIKLKGTQSLYKPSGLLKCALVALLSNACIVQAEEITPFKITSTGGSLSLRYESTNTETNSSSTYESQLWQEELTLNMNSYVYHPNFLKMNFSAGLLANQLESGSTDSNQRVNNLSARLSFLSKRAYPFSLYYDQSNTMTPSSSAGDFLLEHKKYGADISLRSPLTPVTMKLTAHKETSYGTGANQITDDTSNHAKLIMEYSYGSGDHVSLSHQINNSVSRSGSLNLAITERESNTYFTNVKTKNRFGDNKQLYLITDLGLNKQEEFPERESLFFNPTLDWRHNKKFTSYYTHLTEHTDEEGLETDNNRTTARLKYTGDDSLSGILGASLNNSESTSTESTNKGINLGISKAIDVSYGKYSLNYNTNYNIQDQTSSLDLQPVLGDQYTIGGVTPVEITQNNIDTSTIIISNITRTQTYLENLDYNIIVIGDQTLIERLITGNIADGQSILIDYSYQTGGTIKYDRLTQGLNLGLALGKHYNFFANVYDSEQKLKEGIPTTSLNSYDGVTLRFQVKKPLEEKVTLGGEVQMKQHNEESNSYNQQNISANIYMPVLTNALLSVNAGISKRDDETSDEDSDGKTLGFRIVGRPWLRTRLSFDSSYSQNSGGSSDHSMLRNTLDFEWRYRRLNYSATVSQQSEEQGTTEQNDWSIFMKLIRSF